VKVRLILGTEKDALLVPYQAVQIGQQGYYLFAVGKDDKVDLRTVKVGSRQDDMIVVEEGVKEGEEVVTAGQMGLSPGAEVVDAEELKSKRSRRRRPR
jgi:multidrug efflux system membrane fusion protein